MGLPLWAVLQSFPSHLQKNIILATNIMITLGSSFFSKLCNLRSESQFIKISNGVLPNSKFGIHLDKLKIETLS